MKISFKLIFIVFCFFFTPSFAQTQAGNYWENETIFQENKELGHATYIPYSSTADMLTDDYYEKPWLQPSSSLYKSLNGSWKFYFVEEPSQRPTSFFTEPFDASTWDDITFPSTWALPRYD